MLEFLIIIIVLASIVEWVSIKSSNNEEMIGYRCYPSVDGAEPDEEFAVNSEISNLSRSYSPVLRIEERFPKKLVISKLVDYDAVVNDDHRIFVSGVTLRRRQRVRRRLTASLPDRGEYTFSYAKFYAGDFLGFVEHEYRKENDSHIVIYPHRIEAEEFIKSFADAYDEIAMRKQLLEDPISVCGYREYTGREPMRSISWKMSAVRNELIVKEYDPTWCQAVTVVLDTSFHGEFEMHIRRQEYCFMAARTICEYFEDRNQDYTLITNAIINDGISSFHSTGGRGAEFNRILYGLGSAKNGETCSTDILLAEVCSGAFREQTMVFISTRKEEAVMDALARAKSVFGADIITVFADDYINQATEDERLRIEREQHERETRKEKEEFEALLARSKSQDKGKPKKRVKSKAISAAPKNEGVAT